MTIPTPARIQALAEAEAENIKMRRVWKRKCEACMDEPDPNDYAFRIDFECHPTETAFWREFIASHSDCGEEHRYDNEEEAHEQAYQCIYDRIEGMAYEGR